MRFGKAMIAALPDDTTLFLTSISDADASKDKSQRVKVLAWLSM
jgi:hypothetical protein